MRVRVVIDFEIDPGAYVEAGVLEECYADGDIDPTDHLAVAHAATGYVDAEDHLPRWARDSMHVVNMTTDIAEAALDDAAPLIVAAELVRLADELHDLRRTIRDEDGRGIRSSGLAAAINRMRERADELRQG